MKKICSKCRTEKDVDQFYKLTKSRDGKQSYCKFCAKINYRDMSKKSLNNRVVKAENDIENLKKLIRILDGKISKTTNRATT